MKLEKFDEDEDIFEIGIVLEPDLENFIRHFLS